MQHPPRRAMPRLFLNYGCAVNSRLHLQHEIWGPVKRRSQPKTGSQVKMCVCRFTLL